MAVLGYEKHREQKNNVPVPKLVATI